MTVVFFSGFRLIPPGKSGKAEAAKQDGEILPQKIAKSTKEGENCLTARNAKSAKEKTGIFNRSKRR